MPFRQITHGFAGRGIAMIHAQQLRRAAAGIHDGQQGLHQRGLAGPIGTQQAETTAGSDSQIDAFQRMDPAVVGLAQTGGFRLRSPLFFLAWLLFGEAYWP